MEKTPYPTRRKVIPVQVMLPRDYVARLDELARDAAESRSTLVRQAVKTMIEQTKKEQAA